MSELESVVQRLANLEARNHRLEKQNRRIRLAGVAGLLGVAAIASMGQVLPAQFDVVRARAFVVDAGAGEVATLDAEGLRYWEGQQPVTTLGKKHLNLNGIDLSVTENGDAWLTVGQEPNHRIELRSASLGTDIKIEGQPGEELWSAMPLELSPVLLTRAVEGVEVPPAEVPLAVSSPQVDLTPAAVELPSPRYYTVVAENVYARNIILTAADGRPMGYMTRTGVRCIGCL